MRTRRLAVVLAAVVSAISCSPAPPETRAPATSLSAAGGKSDAARAIAIADQVLADLMERSPAQATMLRFPGARYDTLPDDSVAGVAARRKRADEHLAALLHIDRRAIDGTPAALAYDVTKDHLEAEVATRPCHYELWRVSQAFNGWLPMLTAVAQAQPVGTDKARADALARFAKIPAYADAQIESLKEGMKVGDVAYGPTVQQVEEQLDKLLALEPAKSPLYEPAERDGTPAFRASFATLIADQIYPALRRYRDFLGRDYRPHARTSPALSSLPDGAACYKATLHQYTRLDLEPKAVHDKGWAELAKIEAEMKVISAKSFGGADITALMERFRTDREYTYRDRESMMADARKTIERARAAMPRAFGLVPTNDVVVEPIPAFLEKNSAANYQRASLDGKRPATYRIRLYEPEKQSRVTAEAVAFHEAIPGHHLQLDIAAQRTQVPGIARFDTTNSGFSEGWALYAEHVADELGLYSSDADRFGMLGSSAHRAVRLIVDTGIHALGWDRQKAIDTMIAHTPFSRDFAAAEIDRYIAAPGQACSYMMGYLEILALRGEAEKAFGSRFDVKAFHDRILENGVVPLPLLRKNVEAWIKAGTTSR